MALKTATANNKTVRLPIRRDAPPVKRSNKVILYTKTKKRTEISTKGTTMTNIPTKWEEYGKSYYHLVSISRI